jgi:6-phosphogluconate dehydrogenase
VISAALFARFTSRQESSPAMRAVAALRHQFGGHAVHQVGPSGTPGQLAGPSSGTGSTPNPA